MKKPPSVFIVDGRTALLSSLEAAIKSHGFPVQCYSSAARFIAEQEVNQVGCVLVDLVAAPEGGFVLRWLHESHSLLSLVLISGLFASSSVPLRESSSPPSVQPHEAFALLTMVADGFAGSLSRQVIRERSRK